MSWKVIILILLNIYKNDLNNLKRGHSEYFYKLAAVV